MALYSVRQREGGVFYETIISAGSWEEAESRAEEMGGELTGKVEDLLIEDEYTPQEDY